MEMTEYEIIKDYGEAKNKAEQIKILADLNMCSREEIINILDKNGIPHPGARTKRSNTKNKTQKRTRTAWDEQRIEQLRGFVNDGQTLLEISERFGVSPAAVSQQITKHNLRSEQELTSVSSAKVSGVDEIYIRHLEKQLKDAKKIHKDYEAEIMRLKEELHEACAGTDSDDVEMCLINIKGLSHLALCSVKQFFKTESGAASEIRNALVVALANIINSVEAVEEERMKKAPDVGSSEAAG